MKLQEIIYGQLVNTGNYENRKYEVKVLCEESDDPEETFLYAKEQVEMFIDLDFQNQES